MLFYLQMMLLFRYLSSNVIKYLATPEYNGSLALALNSKNTQNL